MFRSLKIAIAVASLVAALAVVPAAGAVDAATPSSWHQLGFNGAHTGVNPNETALSASTVPGLTEKWVSSRGSWIPSNPVVADGDVYWVSGYPRTVVASNATTGARVWARHASYILTDPVVVGNTVYTARFAGDKLFALNAHTGAVLRATPMIDTEGLVYADGVLFTSPYNSELMGAYDAATGRRLWTSGIGPVDGLPAVADGEVFAVSQLSGGARFLVALDAATGHQLWSKPLSDQANATPVVSGKLVFVDTIDGHMTAFNRTTGALVWEKTFGTDAAIDFAPAVFNGRVYQIVQLPCRTIVSVMNAATGAAAWSRVVDACAPVGRGGGDGSPVIANGLVYVPGAKKICIFTTAGKLVKVLSTGDDTVGTPVVTAGRVFVATYGTGRPHGHMQAFGIQGHGAGR